VDTEKRQELNLEKGDQILALIVNIERKPLGVKTEINIDQ